MICPGPLKKCVFGPQSKKEVLRLCSLSVAYHTGCTLADMTLVSI